MKTFQILVALIIMPALKLNVTANIRNTEFVIGERTVCMNHYAQETELRSSVECRALCARRDGCLGVAVMSLGPSSVSCHLPGSYTDSQGLEPPAKAQHWLRQVEGGVGCPDAFTKIGGFGCYYPVLHGTELNWTRADQECKKCGAHLIRFENDQEQTRIDTYMGQVRVNAMWTEARDIYRNNSFRWAGTGGDVNATGLWYSGEPDHGDGDCAYMHASSGGHMHTVDCSKLYPYICEIT